MDVRKQAHCVYYTRYHLVFVTKYRRKVLQHGMGAYLCAVMRNVSKKYPEIEIIEINTDDDHVHLLAIIPPKMTVSKAANLLKSNSARAMRWKFPFLKHVYEKDTVGLWSDGYFVSTIGINESVIKRYIEHQGREDTGQTRLG